MGLISMKSLIALLLLSLNLSAQERPKTFSTPLLNNEEACALNFTKLKSAFSQNQSLFNSITPEEKDARLRTLKQAVILKNGTEVRMIKSGCTNYIFLINIRPNDFKSMQAEYLYQLASDQIKLIPVEKDEEFNMKLILNALDKKNWPAIKLDNDIYYLPCPGAMCTLRTIRENGSPRDIEIIYDKKL
jgi:hypothetical protein